MEVKHMPKRGENIYKRKDGRWEGRYIERRDGRKPVYKSVYASSYKEVREKLLDAKNRKPHDKALNKHGTISLISEEWLKEASPFLKDSSIMKYEDILRCYILPTIGDLEISEITTAQLSVFFNTLYIKGGINEQGLSLSTVTEVISVMNNIRSYSVRHGLQLSFSVEALSARNTCKSIRVFTFCEERKLVDWLCSNMDLTSLSVLLCLFTGLRIGEMCALTWSDFDFESGIIHITKTMQRIRTRNNPEKKTELKILAPKSYHSNRVIPIPSNMLEILNTYRTESDAYVLSGRTDLVVEPRTLQNRFKSILKKCNISKANFHTTRHTFATRCVEKGVDIKCLSEMLGHSNVSITLNRYVHPSLDTKSDYMSIVSDLFPLKDIHPSDGDI